MHNIPSTKIKYQAGATLLELLISLTIGIFLVAGLVSFVIASLSSNTSINKATKFNGDMRSTMTLLANDVRRAAGWGDAIAGLGTSTANPFGSVTTPTTSCILYSYDTNGNGVLDTGSGNDERFGFLLNAGVIKSRGGQADYNCAVSDNWVPVTDDRSIRINELTFSLSTINTPIAGGRTLAIREVTITLAGQMASDPSIRQTLTQTVRIQNDGFI